MPCDHSSLRLAFYQQIGWCPLNMKLHRVRTSHCAQRFASHSLWRSQNALDPLRLHNSSCVRPENWRNVPLVWRFCITIIETRISLKQSIRRLIGIVYLLCRLAKVPRRSSWLKRYPMQMLKGEKGMNWKDFWIMFKDKIQFYAYETLMKFSHLRYFRRWTWYCNDHLQYLFRSEMNWINGGIHWKWTRQNSRQSLFYRSVTAGFDYVRRLVIVIS